MDYSKLISEIREEKQLTQVEMAEVCECSQQYITRLEKGINKKPSIEIMANLVMRLKVNPYVFFIPNYKPRYTDMPGDEISQLRSKVAAYEDHISALYSIMNGDAKKSKTVKTRQQKNRM